MIDPETDICMAVERILKASVPDVQERVLRTVVIPTDARYWPCLLVHAAVAQIETPEGGNPGRRPQARHLMVSVVIVNDGLRDESGDGLRAIGLQVEQALMADPFLKDGGTVPRLSNLVLASTATDATEQRGAVIGVRRLDFIATYRTHEMNPAAIMSRQH